MRSRPRLRGPWLLLACLAGALPASTACGPRYARTSIQDRGDAKVVLRAEVRRGSPVNKGFAHPATISGVRIAHILSRMDIRLAADEQGGARQPAIPTDLIYELGDLVSEALGRADPSQEVVVLALRKDRRFGVFTQTFLTSFIAYVKGEDLVLHLFRSDDLVAKGEEDDIREPVIGREVMRFKVLPSEGIVPVGHQTVAVDWRNPVFRSPTHVRVGPGGKVIRRTILMEAPEAPVEEEARPPDHAVPADPEILRALLDLEESRRDGAITELEYQERRRELLRQTGEP